MNTIVDAVSRLLVDVPRLQDTVVMVSSTATAGGATTLTDSAQALQTNEWKGAFLNITGGTGSGQQRKVASNTATVFAVSTAWTTNPDATSAYTITRPNVYSYDPPDIPGNRHPYAAVDVVSLQEARRGVGWTDTASSGKKWVKHQVLIYVRDVSARPETAHDAFRTLLDDIRAKLRANQTLAEPFGILRSGEDIGVEFARTPLNDSMTQYDATITTEVWEEIDG